MYRMTILCTVDEAGAAISCSESAGAFIPTSPSHSVILPRHRRSAHSRRSAWVTLSSFRRFGGHRSGRSVRPFLILWDNYPPDSTR